MKNKYLAVEDDCAPDAREYFEKDLIKITGLNLNEFREKAIRITEPSGHITDYFVKYEYNGFLLEFSADDPYYRLSKVE
jgi:hypothetical protein